MAPSDVPCNYHQQLVLSVERVIRSNNQVSLSVSQIKKTIDCMDLKVTKMNNALVGTIEEQGLIGKFFSADKEQRAAIDDLVEWRTGINNLTKAILLKIIGGFTASIVISAVVAVAIVKYMWGL